MTCDGKRKRFRSSTGRTYNVQKLPKQDRIGKDADKYWYLERVRDDGKCRICHDAFGDIIKFRTVREAQVFILLNEECVDPRRDFDVV